MRTIEKMKLMTMALMCAVALIGFSGCSDDDEPQNDSPKAAGYKFSLTLSASDDSDQPDIIQTVCRFVDPQGKEVEKTFPENSPRRMTVESGVYHKLPGELDVTLEETLKPDLELTKEFYKVGLGIRLTVVSVDQNGNEIQGTNFSVNSTLPVGTNDLSKMFPKSKTFSYTIDSEGTINSK